MTFETCPLLEELPWVKHGFYNMDSSLNESFRDEFPNPLFLKQTHSDRISLDSDQRNLDADASITSEQNLGLTIRTADCCPVLLACTHSKQIAAIHAGWPGALNSITSKTVEQLISQGAKPETLIVAIGPSINQSTYPVQEDVRAKFQTSQPETLIYFTEFEDRWKMDVAGIVRHQLRSTGVTKIWQSPINTFTDSTYASYRRFVKNNELATPRNVSLIAKV